MSIKTVELKFAYLITGMLSVSYFALQVPDVAIFWMNDEQIKVSSESMYFYVGFHFLLPIILLYNTMHATRIKLFVTHFLAATLSIVALFIAIELSNGTASSGAENGLQYIAGFAYNILKFVSHIFIYFIIAEIAFEKVKGNNSYEAT